MVRINFGRSVIDREEGLGRMVLELRWMEGRPIRIEIDSGDSLKRSHRRGKRGSRDKEKVNSNVMAKCDAMERRGAMAVRSREMYGPDLIRRSAIGEKREWKRNLELPKCDRRWIVALGRGTRYLGEKKGLRFK